MRSQVNDCFCAGACRPSRTQTSPVQARTMLNKDVQKRLADLAADPQADLLPALMDIQEGFDLQHGAEP